MTRWLEGFEQVRQLPRLWVETLWLVESREPVLFTRTIALHPGLNIVWAKESASHEAPSLTSAGHGVGKTSLCLLLRYVLGDEAPSITTLRDKAVGNFPQGGVVAKVHIEDDTWLVFRPYGAHGHSLATQQCETLAPLLQGSIPDDFSDYIKALEQFSIGRLPAPSLPGTNQPLNWRHLLAWCIRDQKTRFDEFYHWRDGDGLGFTRPRRDPPIFVGSVLGLIDSSLDKLLRDIESKQSAIERGKVKISDLERAPIYALAHADHQLRSKLGAKDDEPLHEKIIGTSVESRLQTELTTAKQKEEDNEREAGQLEELLAQEQIHLAELNKRQQLAEVEVGRARALVEANQADYERLTALLDTLNGLDGSRCEHGDVEFSECTYIENRKSTVNMFWRRDGRETQANLPRLTRELSYRESAFDAAELAVSEQSQHIAAKKAELRRLRIRIATSESSRNLLTKSWAELQKQHSQRAEGTDSAELVVARKHQHELETALNGLQTSLLSKQTQQSSRVDAIKSLTACVSTRLLGAAGHVRYVLGDERRPFEVARGGEAYQVLEVLLGDIICLLDSALSSVSSHPGFLVHDCPREADMSERLYREFFLLAAEAAEQLGNNGAVPFQFIVTTTSPPPKEVQGEPYVVLELEPGSEDKLLFKRDLVPQLPGFA